MSNQRLLQLLTCPRCRDSDLLGLDEGLSDGALTCATCEASYPVRGGIPILLPPDFDASNIHDELDHDHEHKHAQADYFDRGVAEEFEITRPAGTPLAYQWLMAEKFRRSVAMLAPLQDATVVDACCGSGMDAEFLARQGASVIALDISEGCAARAKERAERHGLDYLVVVGDIEHLPIRSQSADMAYVHDGLHHLAEPMIGIHELARVASGAISINEPSQALATQIAIRFGLALQREPAGNQVERLNADHVSRELTEAGFQVDATRYLMYYQHEPGGLMRLMSRPGFQTIYRWAVGLANLAIGRWGNKLQLTAVRSGVDR